MNRVGCGWGPGPWVLAHRMPMFPRRKRREMPSVVLRRGGGEVQDGALWATRRTGSSSRELKGAVGSGGGTSQGRSTIGRVPCFQRCSDWGEGRGVVASGAPERGGGGGGRAGLKLGLEGSKMQEVKPA